MLSEYINGKGSLSVKSEINKGTSILLKIKKTIKAQEIYSPNKFGRITICNII